MVGYVRASEVSSNCTQDTWTYLWLLLQKLTYTEKLENHKIVGRKSKLVNLEPSEVKLGFLVKVDVYNSGPPRTAEPFFWGRENFRIAPRAQGAVESNVSLLPTKNPVYSFSPFLPLPSTWYLVWTVPAAPRGLGHTQHPMDKIALIDGSRETPRFLPLIAIS